MDTNWDSLLQIQTEGVQSLEEVTPHLNRYEATGYAALATLADHFDFDPTTHVVDYGCGKGRMLFYLHHRFGCAGVGIELQHPYHQAALNNLTTYATTHPDAAEALRFLHMPAQAYAPSDQDNFFYFFNPFSLPIFMKTIEAILDSLQTHPRVIYLCLYYPFAEYLYYLDSLGLFVLHARIPLDAQDAQEAFVLYRLQP